MAELSLIVPVYNAEKYLHQCLDSILRQKYRDIEVVLVNDGSTDHSYKICSFFASKDPRIVLIDQDNQGQMRATKNGVEAATGKYIGFVDSDDWVSEDLFTEAMELLVSSDADIVIYNGQRVLKKKTVPFNNTVSPGVYGRDEILNVLAPLMLGNYDLYGNRGIQPPKWMKIFKAGIVRELYTKVPLNVRLGEDLACSYYAISIAQRIAVAPLSVNGYFYRLNNQSVSWTYKHNVFSESMDLCTFLRNIPELKDNAEYIRGVDYETCYFTINAYFNEYLINNQKHGQIKIDRLEKIVNDSRFLAAYQNVDITTVRQPNRFLLKLLASKKIPSIRFVGGIMAMFRHIIISISQNR